MRADRSAEGGRAALSLLLTLWLTGSLLRLPILAVPPVAPRIHDDLHVNETWIAILTTLPTLLFAAVAIPGAYLIARLGAYRTLVTGVVLMGLASGLRGAVADRWFLLTMTFFMGAGIALMQPALPSMVRAWFPRRAGFATAIYSNGLLFGELLSASLTIPLVLPLLSGSWRLSFAFWALPVIPALLLLAIHRPAGEPRTANDPVTLSAWWPDWRDPQLWRLGLILGGSASLYFGTNTFLPDFLHATGRAHLTGLALAVLNGSQMASSLLLMVASRRLVARRAPFVAASVVLLAAILALTQAPGVWIIPCVAVIGICCSLVLILSLALPPILTGPGDTHRLSAPMFTIGYTCGFVVPVCGGVLWDLSGQPALAFMPAAAYAVGMIGISLGLSLHPA